MAVALVTGGSRGIGSAAAIRLAEDGHDVAVAYGQREAAAQEAVELITRAGRRAISARADLANVDAAESIVRAAEEELGPVGILIANAGIAAAPTPIAEITVDDWERMIAVNLRAPFLLAQRALPAMAAAGYGRIVFISSVAAFTGGLIGAHYAASKAGLHGMAHSLAQQGAARGVTVNVIAPGLVESDMIPDDPRVREALAASRPVGRLGHPEEVADLISAVVANGYLTNQSIVLDGGGHPT